MPFSLGPRSSRAWLLVLAVTGLLYCYFCLRGFRASELARSGTLDDQLRATSLEPHNAQYWRELGDIRLYRENDPEESLRSFRRATELNPRDADAWIGAAYALQVLDRQNEEQDAILRALAVEPRRLEVIWHAANLYAVLGDRAAMMKEVCILIDHDRRRATDALGLARRAAPNTAGNAVDCNVAEVAP